MKLLVCGDRHWSDRRMIRAKLTVLKCLNGVGEVIHGDCRGADRIAGEEAAALGFTVTAFPADWKTYGTRAGPIRNREMLKAFPNLVWAFHDNLAASRGTRDMVTAARKAGVRVAHFIHSIDEPA